MRSSTHRLRYTIRRRRRLIAALLAGLAVLCLARGITADRDPGIPVIAAATNISAGHTITADDLTTATWPSAQAKPVAFTKPQDAVGRMTSGPILAGELISPARIVSAGSLELDGLVAAPIRLADAGEAALLKPGDHVDVLAARSGASEGNSPADVVAGNVRVITVPSTESPSSQGGILSSRSTGSSASGALVILAVPPSTAAALAGAAARSRLSVVLRPNG